MILRLTQKQRIALTCILVLPFILYCQPTPPPPTPTPTPYREVTYTGRVIEDKTEKPIRGVEVALECPGVPRTNRTDNKGVYLFIIRLSQPANCRVRVTVDGYDNYDLQIIITLDHAGLEEIRLTPLNPTPIPPTPINQPTDTPTPIPSTSTSIPLAIDTPIPPSPTIPPLSTDTPVPILPSPTPQPTTTPTSTPEPTATATLTPPVNALTDIEWNVEGDTSQSNTYWLATPQPFTIQVQSYDQRQQAINNVKCQWIFDPPANILANNCDITYTPPNPLLAPQLITVVAEQWMDNMPVISVTKSIIIKGTP